MTPSFSSLSLFLPFPLFLFPLPSTSERLTGVALPDTAGLPATRRDPRGADGVEGGRDAGTTASGRGGFSFLLRDWREEEVAEEEVAPRPEVWELEEEEGRATADVVAVAVAVAVAAAAAAAGGLAHCYICY